MNPFVLLTTENFRVVMIPRVNYQPVRYDVMFEKRMKDAIGKDNWRECDQVSAVPAIAPELNEVFTALYLRYGVQSSRS